MISCMLIVHISRDYTVQFVSMRFEICVSIILIYIPSKWFQSFKDKKITIQSSNKRRYLYNN